MTSEESIPLKVMPSCSGKTPLLPRVTGLDPNYTQTVHDVTHRQVTTCCMLCSILNYICCPFLGIPALIFAILGTEAEKRREFHAASSHAFFSKIFNIIGAVIFVLYTFIIAVITLLKLLIHNNT
ncbi:hypothetical protein LOD99_7625 [Oopsacas minuta]|uniref:Uncharacterized protein n=1 Tax=Oopsacas minuta TaxID=111878 RepID=A0AAV7JQ82_9METZ|nr:hypothetical protein LOD99_7625 [Oopsacas minuta]